MLLRKGPSPHISQLFCKQMWRGNSRKPIQFARSFLGKDSFIANGVQVVLTSELRLGREKILRYTVLFNLTTHIGLYSREARSEEILRNVCTMQPSDIHSFILHYREFVQNWIHIANSFLFYV
jgi:hypothetical protein